MDYCPPGFFVHGILQARILGWVAVSSSRGSSWSRDQTHWHNDPVPPCHLGSPHIYLNTHHFSEKCNFKNICYFCKSVYLLRCSGALYLTKPLNMCGRTDSNGTPGFKPNRLHSSASPTVRNAHKISPGHARPGHVIQLEELSEASDNFD